MKEVGSELKTGVLVIMVEVTAGFLVSMTCHWDILSFTADNYSNYSPDGSIFVPSASVKSEIVQK